jgi:serine phosphatase RsbU (regulator of sigma subunit)
MKNNPIQEILIVSRISLVAFLIFLVFGLNNLPAQSEIYDPPLLRLIHGISIFLFLISTYVSNQIRERIGEWMLIIFYSMSIHSYYLLFKNGLYFPYLLGMILVVMFVGASFAKKKYLLYYLAFVIFAGILVGETTENPKIDKYIYYLTLFSPAMISFLSINVRLSAVEKLQESEKNLREFQVSINAELEDAELTQKTLIAKTFPKDIHYSIISYYKAYQKVGGDLISTWEKRESNLDILFADVSGHGISAALVSGMAILAFQGAEKDGGTPAQILLNIHKTLNSLIPGKHLSAVCISLDRKSGEVKYSYAGHPPAIVIKNNGDVLNLPGKGNLLLTLFEPQIRDYTIKLEKGDRVFVYSDGFFEVFNKDRKFYGMDAFHEVVKSKKSLKGAEFIESIASYTLNFSGGEPSDDMTALEIEFLGEKSPQ